MQSHSVIEFSDWVLQAVDWVSNDVALPDGLDCINMVLNRKRLAEFLERFSSDSELQDFLVLDLVAVGAESEISSTGEVEELADLALRPFRLWEYIWLYKSLRLSEGGRSVLDLGGPASHIVMLAAFSGNQVHSVDINSQIVEAGRRCAQTFRLNNYRAEVGDMRDLSTIGSNSVDRIICCSVLEHLTEPDQKRALSEMARVLVPGGVIGLTFDYGAGAPGANAHLPPPHEPPGSPDQVRRRYVHSGLEILGDLRIEDPIPGSLFRTQDVSYTMAALFLGKAPFEKPPVPTVMYRECSFNPCRRIPDFIFRLSQKARRDLSRLKLASGFQEAAEERLTALQNADAELHRLYPELQRREEALLEMQTQALEQSKHIERLQSEVLQLRGEPPPELSTSKAIDENH